MTHSLQTLATRLRHSARLTILTGAGVSAASGVRTFRGRDGLWQDARPEDLATAEAFARDPERIWDWYAWRREQIAACRPNPAHDVIAAWSRSPSCRVVTQNVDDLHLAAGTDRLVRLHGSLWELSCRDRCSASPRVWRDERVPLPEVPATCPYCGGLARPAVVWFGESLLIEDVREAEQAAGDCDVFLSIGTSSVVYPAAGLTLLAKQQGAFTVEINAEETPVSSVLDVAIRGAAEEVLPDLKSLIDKA